MFVRVLRMRYGPGRVFLAFFGLCPRAAFRVGHCRAGAARPPGLVTHTHYCGLCRASVFKRGFVRRPTRRSIEGVAPRAVSDTGVGGAAGLFFSRDAQRQQYMRSCVAAMRAFSFLSFTSILQHALAAGWSDDFSSFNASLWSQATDIEHCTDGACFKASPDHLRYSPAGLLVSMNRFPCNETAPSCCVGAKCAQWASGKLASTGVTLFGTYSARLQPAHRAGDATPPALRDARLCLAAAAAAVMQVAMRLLGIVPLDRI